MKSETLKKSDRPKQADAASMEVADELMKLVGLANSNGAAEQRVRDRSSIYFCMQLTPLDSAGRPLPDQQISVVGKDLSTQGVSFSHDSALPSRRLVLCID